MMKKEMKREKRKALERKALKEIGKEEGKLLVIGFLIASHEAVLPGLMTVLMRENVNPSQEVTILWMKEVCRNSQNRDWILINLLRQNSLLYIYI